MNFSSFLHSSNLKFHKYTFFSLNLKEKQLPTFVAFFSPSSTTENMNYTAWFCLHRVEEKKKAARS